MSRNDRRRQERLVRQAGLEDRERAAGHFNLGCALQNQGKHAEAAAAYRAALAIHPEDADARNNLGNVLGELGEAEESIACYRRVIEIDPAYVMAHFNLGNALRIRGELEEAAACYSRALDLRPDYADACNNLGIVRLAQGALDDALVCFYRAVAADPNHVHAHYNCANILRDKGEHKKAIASYRRVLELNPKRVEARARLGHSLYALRKFDEAEACFRAVLASDPDHVSANFGLADTLKQKRRFEEAIAQFKRVLELEPHNANAWNNLGNTYKDRDMMAEAVACYERALEIDPDHPDARLNFSREHTFVPGDPALDRLKALLDRKGWDADKRNQITFALGQAHDDIGLYAEAFDYFRQGNEDWARRVSYDREAHRRDTAGIVEAFPTRRELPPVADAEQVPVFVVGLSRAGKTLSESILGQGRSVFAAGERHHFITLIGALRTEHGITEPYPDCASQFTPAHLRELGARYMAEIARHAEGARFLVNTLPGNYRYIGLILQALPNARVIHCRRNALDQCLQIYFKRYGSGNYQAYTFENIASYWIDYAKLMAHWQRLYGEHILEVWYDDVVSQPAREAARIFGHCGIDYDPEALRHEFSTRQVGHWRNYERFLGPLRLALGDYARDD